MCGITGFIDFNANAGADWLATTVTRMSDTITHRGPDDSGHWIDAECGVALGFRRLAILDLTPSGHQPMHSADGRYVIVFNGEVYNFKELRAELSALGHTFAGTSDTEVMLASICEWGLEAAVKRFNGMFAFALWDRRERNLALVRDRLGIKPLYYGWSGTTFLFGSELKTLRAHPAFQTEIDRNSLALMMRHNYIPAPHSIYQGVHKLLPGTILTVSATAAPGTDAEAVPAPYWSMREAAERGCADPFRGTPEEAVGELDDLLRRSIRDRMIADVPLGAFLSGGVDSSTIVAVMQTQSSIPVRTFTIGFNETEYDEAGYARAVAKHLGTDHTELYVTPQEAMAVIPRLPALFDEPFSDSSQIPTLLVAQLARAHVTVALSGDGGDELFAGYPRYAQAEHIWKRYGLLPAFGRKPVRRALELLAPDGNDRIQNWKDLLRMSRPQELYARLVSHYYRPGEVVRAAAEPGTALTERDQDPALPGFAEWMMYADQVTYLPDDILVKVDRASMGVSLEARAPLLDDHRVVEWAWRLPLSMKVREGSTKWALRQVLYRYVPRELIERPKMGFGIPLGQWLRGPLRDWGEALLNENRLKDEGFFNPAPIRRLWIDHVEGRAEEPYRLWDVLMFQAWLASQQ
jgi:asparagine synthase (glutamine-hydrolysing)